MSNNLTINNVELTGQVPTSDYNMIKFDMSWENSWRTSTLEQNWDAVWIIAKWRLKNTIVWNHGTIHTSGHTAPAGSTITPSADGTGVFIYRNSDGIGNISWTGARLRWNYGVDGIQDSDSVEICVFGVEMVYIPQGGFYLGDGGTGTGQFHDAVGTSPFAVNSENAITLGGLASGNLGNQNTVGMLLADDYDNVTTQTLPVDFPKGYNAYYSMKYEVSQSQYVEFLNKLTYTQQASRVISLPNSVAGTYAFSSFYRGAIVVGTAGVSASTPAVYASNLDGDGTYNELNDGQHIACNWIRWEDLAAFLDWCGLRPMTELEYEKTCRGDYLSAEIGEYAWGNSEITSATGILNSGSANEVASNPGANCVHANEPAVQGPMRVGCFAQAASTRTSSGGSYYGVLDLTGNLYERTISTGNSIGRAFTGLHGDGTLDVNGNADVVNWPGVNAIGTGLKGGSYYDDVIGTQVSERQIAAWDINFSDGSLGGRGVRTAP